MEDKYYNKIVSLIQEHKKYADYEGILSEIAEDVYERAKVILSTIADEDVLTAYLQKVIATSIVTVPKKLGITSKNSRPSLLIEDVIKESSVLEKKVEIEETIQVDEAEELMPESSMDESLALEETIEESETEVSDIEQAETFEPIEVPEVYEINEVSEEAILEEPNLPLETEESIVSEPVNKELVDKMINGTTHEFTESPDSEFIEESEGEKSDFEELEDITLLDDEVIEEVEVVVESTETEESNETDYIEETLVSTEDEVDDVFEDFEIQDSTVEENFVINTGELLSEDLVEELEQVTPLEDDLELDSEIITEETELEAEAPLYTCFTLDIEENSYGVDIETISSDLLEADKKYPNLRILEICNLKYKEGKSILEIAEALNIDKYDVLEALNEIIDAVKD